MALFGADILAKLLGSAIGFFAMIVVALYNGVLLLLCGVNLIGVLLRKPGACFGSMGLVFGGGQGVLCLLGMWLFGGSSAAVAECHRGALIGWALALLSLYRLRQREPTAVEQLQGLSAPRPPIRGLLLCYLLLIAGAQGLRYQSAGLYAQGQRRAAALREAEDSEGAKRWADAASALERAEREGARVRPRLLLARARAKWDTGDWPAAIPLFEQAQQAAGGGPALDIRDERIRALGLIAARDGDWPRALEHWSHEERRIGTTHPRAELARAMLHLEAGQLHAALRKLTLLHARGHTLTLPLDEQVTRVRKQLATRRQKLLASATLADLEHARLIAPLDDQSARALARLRATAIPTARQRALGLAPGPQPGQFVSTRDGSLLVWVPAGRFLMFGGAQLRVVELSRPYLIGLHEVTWAQYLRYCAAKGKTPPEERSAADHPAGEISYREAQSYCSWAGLRLPTEAEWAYAARGSDGRVHPWGAGKRTPERARWRTEGTHPVTALPAGRAPFGLFGTADNLQEWVADRYAGARTPRGAYPPPVLRDPAGPKSGFLAGPYCVRGGYFGGSSIDVSAVSRRGLAHEDRRHYIGFRVARSLER